MQSISRTEATSDRDPPGELRVRQRSARLVTSPYIAGVENLDDARWLAVQQRDATSAGLFVYAVRTTGVYCRSGCGARRALRANVEFFATGDEAAAAGYRPCQKCRPDRPEALNPSLVAVIAACRWLEQPGTHDVARFAASLGFSERHLRRCFTAVVGVPIGSYQRSLRADRAREALKTGSSVTDAVVESGYGSTRGFYEHGASRLGMTPARYRKGGRGELISYTSIRTPLGFVVAAGTKIGLCAVRLGPDEVALIEGIAQEFPLATLERDDEGLCAIASVLSAGVRGEGDPTRLPTDLAGTAFQIRVWEALRKIPLGQTATYSQVAKDIGAPRSVRAVASACAANPVAIVVPCHRVLRRDGTLGGYRWGLDVKRALLEAERAGQALAPRGPRH